MLQIVSPPDSWKRECDSSQQTGKVINNPTRVPEIIPVNEP